MQANEFVAYVGDPDIHDAHVRNVSRAGDQVEVELESINGRRFNVVFTGTRNLVSHDAKGMLLYSLSEMRSDLPYRKFVFTNSDERSSSRLEVEAQHMSVSD